LKYYTTKNNNSERAILVGVVKRGVKRWLVEESIDELELLAVTAGADVLESVIQERDRTDPAYLIGRGKVEELAQMAKYLDADLVIFDEDLSPGQAKNIENICDVKIVDRSGLILDIFASRAKTREARTQVELAQLQYLLPRLTRRWTHLSRQEGGIGLRGPGETQIEVDRRMIRRRIAILSTELEKIGNQRKIRRKQRQGIFKAALVGYTNVGKSTLMNALSQADIFVEDRLFATLDATIRVMTASEQQKVLLIDTVGFIRKLPHHLIASFKSTLEETLDADLLLHVIDITHPHFCEQMKTVSQVLEELGVGNRPVLNVFNKIDLLKETGLIARLKIQERPCVFISAKRGVFLEKLEHEILNFASQKTVALTIAVPTDESKTLSRIYDLADVLSVDYLDSQAILKLKSTPQNAHQIQQLIGEFSPNSVLHNVKP
jgi:GTP-binding protein HflX